MPPRGDREVAVAQVQDLPAGWEEPVATGKQVQAGESIYPLG